MQKLNLNCDKQWLEVTEMNLTHNHETDQQVLPPFSAKKIRQRCKLQHSCVHMVLFTYIEFVYVCSIVHSSYVYIPYS